MKRSLSLAECWAQFNRFCRFATNFGQLKLAVGNLASGQVGCTCTWCWKGEGWGAQGELAAGGAKAPRTDRVRVRG